MNEQMSVGIGARITDFTRKMSQVTRSLKAVPNRVTTQINVRIDKFDRNINTIATRMRSIGMVLGSGIKGGLLAALPALSPVIASLTAALGGLVTTMATAGTGFALFGAVATSALNDVFSANGDIKKLREELANTKDIEKRGELLSEIAQATKDLSSEQQRGLKAVQSFGAYWGKFSKQFEKPVMDLFIRSLDGLRGLLVKLQPAFDGAVSAVETLADSMGKATQTKAFNSFIDFINNSAGPAMVALGKIFGNIMQGIMNLMVAFGPTSVDMQDGLVKLTEKFAKWADGLKDSKAFQNFINYVKENGPKVMSLIGNLTTFLVELGKGMAPLGSKVLDLVNGFLSWSNEMMKANPIIGKIIGIILSLGGVLLSLTPFIILTKAAFGGMATAIWTATGMMRAKLVTGIGMMIKSLGRFVVSMVTTVAKFIAQTVIFMAKMVATSAKFVARWVFMGAQALVQAARVAAAWFIALGPVGWVIATVIALVALVIANWDKVKAFTQKLWSATWLLIKGIASKIKDWVMEKFGGVFSVVKKYMDMVGKNIKTAWNFIKDSFGNALSFVKSLLKGDFKGMWNAVKDQMSNIKDTVSSIWDNVMDFLRGINLFTIGKNIISGMIDGIKDMADGLIDSVTGVVDGAINGAKKLLGIASPSKLFKKLGEYTGQGLVEGMDKMKNKVARAGKNMAKASTPKLKQQNFANQMKASIGRASNKVQASVNHTINTPIMDSINAKQPVVVNVYDNKESVRAYVNENNAVESEIRRF